MARLRRVSGGKYPRPITEVCLFLLLKCVCRYYKSVFVSITEVCLSLLLTASLALWLRRPPRERKIPGANPACAGFFRGRVIPVT